MDTLPIELCERGLVPDTLARAGMRRLIAGRLTGPEAQDGESRNRAYRRLLERARRGPIAEHTEDANAQHYEVPAAFFHEVLGPRLKYSACLFESPGDDLERAEEAMLALYAQRAGLADGQRILDLGCGWGSFCLWAAARFPGAEIHAVSNAEGQREYIARRAERAGLSNLRVETCDINVYTPAAAPFDRVVSVEMFEHMRNYRELTARVASWLTPEGRAFIHIFCHRLLAYAFHTEDRYDWMGRHFFTGGIMPSEHWPLEFQEDLVIRDHWWVSGLHYRATADAWLANLDRRRAAVRELFQDAYGPNQADRWIQRWRMFFMAVSELFGFENGNQWGVGHYLFGRRP